jgi:hypothetical protein
MNMADEIIVGPGQTFTTISAAVAAANEFDTIRVTPGIYNEQVIIDKTIQLHGAQSGADARNRVGDESIITSNNIFGIVRIAADNVVFDGFTVQNNSQGPGIRTEGFFSGHWIFNNIIQNNVFGIYFNSSGDTISQAIQNFIRDNNQPGDAFGNGIYTDGGSSNVYIDSNRFEGPHANASINFASVAPNQQNIIISNNQMIADNSIALTNTTNVKVKKNSSIGTQGSSIFFGGGTSNTEIESNILHNSISNGINVTDVFTGTPNSNIRAKLNSIEGNAIAGLTIAPGAYDDAPPNRPLDATNNWWGSSSGPFPIGTGDAVIDPDDVAIVTPFLEADPIGPTSEELLEMCEQELSEVQAELVEFLPVVGNRLHNPSFELGLARWQTAGHVTGERSPTADEGERVAQLLPTQTTNAVLSQMVKMALQADFLGIEYSVRALENPPNAPVPVSPALTVQILWYDSNFQLLRTDIVDQIDEGDLPIDLNWTRRSFTTNTKPAGTIQARLRFIASEGSSSTLQIDNAVVGWRTA